ncbi:MAG: prolipoprotein diacylglyceryl transferase [Nocardioidaceae bacterium]
MILPLSIPSPSQGVWHLGPFPLRGYALCIIAGILAAIWIGERRWIARGGRPNEVTDLALWAVPFGLVGGRLYHVITDYERYFGPGKSAWAALYVWRGGLGIWGAIALGAVGVLIGAHRKGIRVAPMLDALAPGVLVAQALGRWGNWFNQELFGRPTDLPWGLRIDPDHRPPGYEDVATFHPTFLYECVWNLGAFAFVVWADRRFRLGHGRVFALYVMAYTAGRGWIEDLRIDPVQMSDVGGLRLNVWVSIVVFVSAAAYFVWAGRARPGRETEVYLEGRAPEAEETATDETDPDETATDETATDGAATDETATDGAADDAPEGDGSADPADESSSRH